MGCANSRLENLPAVALCRDRCKSLDQALRANHAFVEAHFAYVDSLKSLSPSLAAFFAGSNGGDDSSAAKHPPPAAAPNNPDSPESHLQFPPDSDDEKDKDEKRGCASLNDDETRRLIEHNFGFSNPGGGEAPPPPSPPQAALGSAWDFLNLFDTFEKYERLYCADLECTDPEKAESEGGEEKAAAKEVGETTTFEVKIVDEKKNEMPEKVSRDSSESNSISEVQALFIRASESGSEVSKLLYHCHSQNIKQDSLRVSLEEDFGLSSSVNLTTSLKKLLLWDKKLYSEVKAEEKLRLLYQRKLRELKYLESETAKVHKANSTRDVLRNLTTKLKIAFQIIDRISNAINKLRDEELWPQIKELNQRLLPMYKTMLECHKSQYQKIAEAKGLNVASPREKLSASHLKAAIELKLELQTWSSSFSDWVSAQKDYTKSMHDWLLRCVLYDPEETPGDDLFPFSPGEFGAPLIFVICYHWSQALDRLSEKEVIAAIKGFIAYIDSTMLRDRNVDIQQIVTADKEMERRVKILEKNEQKILHKKHSEVASTFCGDSQQGMMNIFMAIEKFLANSVQVYEEICLQIDQDGRKGPERLIDNAA